LETGYYKGYSMGGFPVCPSFPLSIKLTSRRFLWDKERELWDTFQELDKNGDGRLDAVEMKAALSRSGIETTPAVVEDLVRHLAHGVWKLPKKDTLSQEDMYITFGEFRDFLIMLPRRATPLEIYKCKSPSLPDED
jgi:solute carrier family 25 phosphate transporter 23/24/25/41